MNNWLFLYKCISIFVGDFLALDEGIASPFTINVFNFNINENYIIHNRYYGYNKSYESYNYGPIIEGNNGFTISNNCNITKSEYYSNLFIYSDVYSSYEMINNKALNKYNFLVKEYEIYQIIFD